MERIGIYGGTFNPPHLGHMQAAQQAVQALGLNRLLLIPDRIAPHKTIPVDSPTPEQRLQMLRLAAEADMEVSDLELRREGPSYTWETIRTLKSLYPDEQLVLLMGSDMFLTLTKWVNPRYILENAAIGVFFRGDKGERQAVEAEKTVLEQSGATVYLVENDVLQISSTQLRRMLVFRSAGAFVPKQVETFIREKGLYGTARDYRNLPVEELEQVVVSLLKPNRVAHVLGCRQTAVELAKRWGICVADAERGALLHDITKALDGHLQLALCREYGVQLDDFSLRYPKTLHALTGSLVADRIFGENPAVVDAICCHTTGKANMNTLDKIIYMADYMEPTRTMEGVEQLRLLAFTDLDAAVKLGLEMTLQHLARLDDEISPVTREALDFFNIV